MGNITAQAQDAINRLKAAGWKRNQFSVKTRRLYVGRNTAGKAMYEYGGAIISLRNSSKEKALSKVISMATQGFHVSIYKFKNGHFGWPNVIDE